ncbi:MULTISPECIES: hypothetical protein [unclassified Streptomyces]|uniref:hypothetical protein n=1 Tax=unclassified Streptomyces TaxID=2593676 RepID=UPI0036FC9969
MTWQPAPSGAAVRVLRAAAGRRALRTALLLGGLFALGLLCGQRAHAAEPAPAGTLTRTAPAGSLTSATAPAASPATATATATATAKTKATAVAAVTVTDAETAHLHPTAPVTSLPARLDLPSLPAQQTLPVQQTPPTQPSLPEPSLPDASLPAPPLPAPSMPAPPVMPAPPAMPGAPALPALPSLPSVPDGPQLPTLPGAGDTAGAPGGAAHDTVDAPQAHEDAPRTDGAQGTALRAPRFGPAAPVTRAQQHAKPYAAAPAPAPVPPEPAGGASGAVTGGSAADNSTPRHGDAHAVTPHHRLPLPARAGTAARCAAPRIQDRYRDIPVFPA